MKTHNLRFELFFVFFVFDFYFTFTLFVRCFKRWSVQYIVYIALGLSLYLLLQQRIRFIGLYE